MSLLNKKGNLNIRGKLVASTIGALIGWYVVDPIVRKTLQKVAS